MLTLCLQVQICFIHYPQYIGLLPQQHHTSKCAAAHTYQYAATSSLSLLDRVHIIQAQLHKARIIHGSKGNGSIEFIGKSLWTQALCVCVPDEGRELSGDKAVLVQWADLAELHANAFYCHGSNQVQKAVCSQNIFCVNQIEAWLLHKSICQQQSGLP